MLVDRHLNFNLFIKPEHSKVLCKGLDTVKELIRKRQQKIIFSCHVDNALLNANKVPRSYCRTALELKCNFFPPL